MKKILHAGIVDAVTTSERYVVGQQLDNNKMPFIARDVR
jgi:hypothetical protein